MDIKINRRDIFPKYLFQLFSINVAIRMNAINVLKMKILGTKTGLVIYEIIISSTGEAKQMANKTYSFSSLERINQSDKRTKFKKKTNKIRKIFQFANGANPNNVITD
ncbi:MAG: hypothetical protein ACYDH1_13690 [Anaerolineaceae bacterium]